MKTVSHDEANLALVTGKSRADQELSTFYDKVLPADLSAARRLTYATLPKLVAPQSQRENSAAIAATRAVILGNSAAGIAAALDGMAKRPDVTDMLGGIAVPAA